MSAIALSAASGAGVVQLHRMAGSGGHLGDASAHGAAADHGDDAGTIKCCRHRLISLELRRTLFHERIDAFTVVVRCCRVRACSRAPGCSCCSSVLDGLAYSACLVHARPLVGAVAKCRAMASLPRHSASSVDAFPDQAPAFRAFSALQLVAQQRQAHGARGAEQARQEVGAAGIRDQAELQKASTKEADLAAITMSQASARLAPAPAATPLTAQITGIGRLRSASTSGA